MALGAPSGTAAALGAPSGTAAALGAGLGRHVDSSTLVDALREGADLQQGAARHRVTGPVDTVQLLSAAVQAGGQPAAAPQQDQSIAGQALGALAPAGGEGSALLSTSAAAQRAGSASPDLVLLLTTAGAALALAGTALETARRQRVRAAVARGRGRRALR